jgi:hypothetical protein
MTRGKPLEGAPGWRVIERPRPQPRKRRASVIILAIAAGLLLVFAVTYRYQVGWPQDHHPQIALPSATVAPRTDRGPSMPKSVAEAPGRRALAARPEPEIRETPRIAKPQAAPGAPSAPDSLRIFIHYPAHHDDAVPAIRLAALLQTRGFPIVDIRLVELEIDEPSVRYFFPGDRAVSRSLVDVIGTLAPHLAPDKATDFSHFFPKPRPGTVELWLPAAGPGPMAQDSSS